MGCSMKGNITDSYFNITDSYFLSDKQGSYPLLRFV